MQRCDLKKCGDRLRQLRLERKMTQQHLATLCGVSRKTVIRWEAGESLPDPQVFATLMVLFEANYRYLVGAHDNRYFIRADLIDAEIWNLWHSMDPSGRASLKEMARWLVRQGKESQPA